MKRKILSILAISVMLLLAFTSCGKKQSDVTDASIATATPKITSTELKDFFPYTEGVSLTYKDSSSSKEVVAKVKTTDNNSVVISHNEESKIEFNNEGLKLNNEFLLKLPIEKDASWDTSNGKVTIKNTNYVLSTPLGNISTIEVYLEGSSTTYYIAKNLGIVKAKVTKDGKDTEYYLTSISASKDSTEEPSNPGDGDDKPTPPATKTSVSKLYYYDVMEDAIVYSNTSDSVTEKTAPSYFEDKFKNPPKDDLKPLISSSTKIKSIKVDKEKSLVTMDVSEVFTNSMNLGAGPESGVLQGIANTLGKAYDCKNVIVTVNGGEFVTGHSEINANDPLTVNFDGNKELK